MSLLVDIASLVTLVEPVGVWATGLPCGAFGAVAFAIVIYGRRTNRERVRNSTGR